jgi:signal transduction histidine kinase
VCSSDLALQLRQALCNLLGNAIKYTPADGTIKLSVDVKEQHLTVSVKDTGYGIPPEDLPFIFDRFYRSHNRAMKKVDSNGLGLAIVKSIVERHDGSIGVKSEPGKGSCFTLTLPLSRQETAFDPNAIPETA